LPGPIGAIGSAALSFGAQFSMNLAANGGDIMLATKQVDYGNVIGAAVVGFFIPGGLQVVKSGFAWIARGASFNKFAANSILAGIIGVPLKVELGGIIPELRPCPQSPMPDWKKNLGNLLY